MFKSILTLGLSVSNLLKAEVNWFKLIIYHIIIFSDNYEVFKRHKISLHHEKQQASLSLFNLSTRITKPWEVVWGILIMCEIVTDVNNVMIKYFYLIIIIQVTLELNMFL